MDRDPDLSDPQADAQAKAGVRPLPGIHPQTLAVRIAQRSRVQMLRAERLMRQGQDAPEAPPPALPDKLSRDLPVGSNRALSDGSDRDLPDGLSRALPVDMIAAALARARPSPYRWDAIRAWPRDRAASRVFDARARGDVQDTRARGDGTPARPRRTDGAAAALEDFLRALNARVDPEDRKPNNPEDRKLNDPEDRRRSNPEDRRPADPHASARPGPFAPVRDRHVPQSGAAEVVPQSGAAEVVPHSGAAEVVALHPVAPARRGAAAGGLETLPDAGPGMIAALQRAGITSLAGLAVAAPDRLARRLGPIGPLVDLENWIAFAGEAMPA